MWKKETGLEWLSREEEELVVKVPTDTGKDICMPSATVDKCLNTLKRRNSGVGGVSEWTARLLFSTLPNQTGVGSA